MLYTVRKLRAPVFHWAGGYDHVFLAMVAASLKSDPIYSGVTSKWNHFLSSTLISSPAYNDSNIITFTSWPIDSFENRIIIISKSRSDPQSS